MDIPTKVKNERFDWDEAVQWWPGNDDFGTFERNAMADFVRRMSQPEISIHKPIASAANERDFLIRHGKADSGNEGF